jgi:hypothetical protein
MEDNKKSGSSIAGIVFAGCMFLGAGIGMLNNATKTGAVIGMGVGLIAMGAISAYYRNK